MSRRWLRVLGRYGKHRAGVTVASIAARLGDDRPTQIIARVDDVPDERPTVVLPRIIVPEPAPTPVSYWTTPVPMRAVAA